jgi:hypothetical protein
VDPVTLAPNYGEESVEAATAYMSGFNEDAELIEPYGNYSRVVNYSADQHDATPRTVFPGISGAATNATFSPHGFADYVLDHHPGAARYIGAKLFAQMVNPEVSADVTANLAASLVQDGFALNGTMPAFAARFPCAVAALAEHAGDFANRNRRRPRESKLVSRCASRGSWRDGASDLSTTVSFWMERCVRS